MTDTLNPAADALEAGQHAAFGAAAVVGVLAVGASLYDRLAGPHSAAPLAEAPNYADAASTEDLELTATPEAPATHAPELTAETATPVVFNVSAHMLEPLPLIAPAFDAGLASDVAFQEEALRLNQTSPFSRSEDEAVIQTDARVHAPQSVSARLNAMAGELSYHEPLEGSRDVALFVAGDDEAVSWALNGSSPNYGAVAYEEGRVDVGNLSAGVALTTDDVRVAAAYVERDMDMRLGRGFENRDQHYAGVIVTFKN
ncbi:MAG: hypothetical protein NW206_10910 [Hyphomonadaceae bacterium]|nr:hypothetical protein [Hyphomonadaceae bacterium]